jgi:3-hydroxyacyl-[acyl-carrier-protein] dehydratase
MPCLGTKEIEAILPQRYPFLLIDRVLDHKEDDYLIAVKNITGNEWGSVNGVDQLEHWPETLLIEAGAQAAIVLYHVSKVKDKKPPQYFLGKVESDFFSPIRCGAQMTIAVKSGKMMNTGGYSDVEISENNTLVANLKMFYGVRPLL